MPAVAATLADILLPLKVLLEKVVVPTKVVALPRMDALPAAAQYGLFFVAKAVLRTHGLHRASH